jgi:DNA-directed RNA polymerase specialized sigma24 family protein
MVDDARLSQLSTQWSLLAAAQRKDDPAAAREAQAELLPRYCPAVFRYLLGAVRDRAAAEDLCQEFAVRFVRGDFRHARPDKGRFRDYVKAALFHLVGEYRRGREGVERQVLFDSRLAVRGRTPADGDEAFREACRRELLNRTWDGLADEYDGPPPTPYHALRRKADDPRATSAALADAFTTETGRAVTAANVRQLVHRGRERFAEVLRREVAADLGSADPAEVDAELADLGLLEYCPRAGAV